MPASEDTSYNMKLLHRIFAVSSVALLAVTVWALIADHDRPWKQYQRDYRNAERTRVAWELKGGSTTAAADARRRADLEAELDRLTPTWFSRQFPWLGTKWLELPLLDAFNSPVRIDQVWLPELVQDYHHHQVERFDRCITCHVGSDQTRPGSATEPLFPGRRQVTLRLATPPAPADETTPSDPPASPANSELPTDTDRVAQLYGMAFASHGMLPGDGVSVRRVEPNSLAAQATVVPAPPPGPAGKPPADGSSRERTGAEIRQQVAAGTMFGPAPAEPGLEVGDVLVAVNGSPVGTRQDAERALLDEVEWGQAVMLTVARGVPQPFAAHPRLDLFLGATSPHPLQEVGCTICHAGQGSATAFGWATHTPDDLEAEDRWRATHDWFRDPHWESPMLPRRFIESSCIKCHHNVTDLQASSRFPDAPAPKVVAGYKLVRRYGCYGCHEMSGYDVTGRPIGPDLRLEPNDHAVAQALMNDPGFRELAAEFRQGIEGLLRPPVRRELKQEIRQLLLDDARRDTPRLSSASHRLADALRDRGQPGTLRKVGPSLRYVAEKIDLPTLRRWIGDPRDYRPDTRMPRFFGLWNHLHGTALEVSQAWEPAEILGIASYLTDHSEAFELLTPPSLPDEAAQQAAVRRGRAAFEFSGCLACHQHDDFPHAKSTQGPDLSLVTQTLAKHTNRKWLYTWLRDPQRYHPRSVMPNMLLDPTVADDGSVTDPAADITAYLLASSGGESSATLSEPSPLGEPSAADLDALVLLNLQSAFPDDRAQRYLRSGIPADVARGLAGIERELVAPLTRNKKLRYIGGKAIAVHGCSGCHDIPGFEGAKPIGPALTEWGRKKESLLDCGRIGDYLSGSAANVPLDSSAAPGTPDAPPYPAAERNQKSAPDSQQTALPLPTPADTLAPYYARDLERSSRIGFLAQKLREPRSFDYQVAERKKYYSRLQMPQFPFDSQQREQVMTFVLGLVAQPPPQPFVYHPGETQQAILTGRELLDKYNCASCHVLRPQRWDITYRSGEIPPQPPKPTFPFVTASPSAELPSASPRTDEEGRLQATLGGVPAAFDLDGLPLILDEDEEPLEDDEDYDPDSLFYLFDLWDPAVLDGQAYRPGVTPLLLTAPMISRQQPADGGDLVRLLARRAVERVQDTNPAAKGSEARAWLPPPLIGEGRKVQSQWLRDYLLDPTPIRPAVLLRMPRFPVSSNEAEQLAQYFALVDGAEHPYGDTPHRRPSSIAAARARYDKRLAQLDAQPDKTTAGDHFDDAMRIVVDKNYCVTCHKIARFSPGGDNQALAPDLAEVYRRLRPGYLRRWIADPAATLPYTAMPAYIPFDANAPHLGGVPQDLYHGTSLEQLDALVDLLMNFDRYTLEQQTLSSLQEAAGTPGEEP